MVEQESGGGEWVRYLKRLLSMAGYWQGSITQQYGPDVEDAVQRFQNDHGLKNDGIARGETWAALAEEADQGQPLDIDWRDYPEINALATSQDLPGYLREVVRIDPSVFDDELTL